MSNFNVGDKLCVELCVCAECEMRMICKNCYTCDPNCTTEELSGQTDEDHPPLKECRNPEHKVWDNKSRRFVKYEELEKKRRNK